MTEIFKSTVYTYDSRFHIWIDNRFSLIMLEPQYYGYMYELYDLKTKELERFSTIIEAVEAVKKWKKRK